jgi:uncharacterized protein YcbK (DUF882 family)
MKLSLNFSKSEFESKDGAFMPIKILKNIEIVSKQLQVLRDSLKKPITINSGYRSPAHNKAIGGVKNSQHTLGKAADIAVDGMKPKEVAKEIEALILSGDMMHGGIGVYATFVHYDIRGKKARW